MKKNILKYTGISILFLMVTLSSYAQEKRDPEKRKVQKEEIASAKKDFIKNELNLTADEEKAFWALYDKMGEEIKSQKQQKNAIGKELRAKKDALTDAEFKTKGEELINIDQKINEIKRSYFHKMGAVITYKKVVKLHHVEQRFKKELLKKLKNNHPKAVNTDPK